MKFTKLTLTTIALATALAASEISAGPAEDAQYIVEQTVTKEIFEGAMAAQRPLIISATQNDMREKGLVLPDPERFFDLFMEEFIDEFTESMQQQTAAIYLDLFSAEELNEIAAFYGTDAGQNLIDATPALMMRGAELGRKAGFQAGRNAGSRLADRIEIEGLIETLDPSLMKKLMDYLR